MLGLHDERKAVGLRLFLDQVGQLHHGLFLDLRAAHDPFGQARVLRQADHVGVLVGHHADPELADDRAEVVRAGAAHGDRADDHQLVQVLGVGKFGERGRRHVAAAEHLVQVHLGDAARGVVGVVVVLDVDDEAFEHGLHLDLDLVEQPLQLAGLDELGDVVVGIEALARCIQSLADLDGDGRALVIVFSIGKRFDVGFPQHPRMVSAIFFQCPCRETARNRAQASEKSATSGRWSDMRAQIGPRGTLHDSGSSLRP
jgi:hypothetical protein